LYRDNFVWQLGAAQTRFSPNERINRLPSGQPRLLCALAMATALAVTTLLEHRQTATTHRAAPMPRQLSRPAHQFGKSTLGELVEACH
jgi:hypothetical protein